MKKNINIILIGLASFLLSLTACQNDDVTRNQDMHTDSNAVNFSIAQGKTRAVGDENNVKKTPALEREKTINSLYAVIFEAEHGLFYQTVECTPGSATGDYKFDMKRAGKFYFYLIANPDEALKSKLNEGPVTDEDLFQVIAKQTPGDDNNANNFLMTSDKVTVETVARQPQTLATPIKLVRVAARFDFYNRVEGLKITSVQFKNRYVESRVKPSLNMDGLVKNDDKIYPMDGSDLIATVYGYENSTRGETEFVLEGTFNGKPVKPYSFKLENMPIKRNYLYSVIINPDQNGVEPTPPGEDEFGKLKFDIVVMDWNEGELLQLKDEELLQPLKVYHDVMSIGGTDLISKYLPQNIATVETATRKATTVQIKVTSYIKPGTLEAKKGTTLPAGVSITPVGESTKTSDGKFEQLFNVSISNELDVNTYEEYELEVVNGTDTKRLPLTIKHGRHKMPLESVAEYNLGIMDAEGNVEFATSHKNNASGYFYRLKGGPIEDEMAYMWDKNKAKFANYHIPTNVYEFMTIIPMIGSPTHPLVGPNAIEMDNEARFVLLPWKANKSPLEYDVFANDYRHPEKDSPISYALRFKKFYTKKNKGNDGYLLQAVRYEVVGDLVEGNLDSHLKITSRFLGKQFNNGSVDEIANEEFWNTNNQDDVNRIFPFTGEYNDSGVLDYLGKQFNITAVNKKKYKEGITRNDIMVAQFNDNNIFIISGFGFGDAVNSYNVRLFEND